MTHFRERLTTPHVTLGIAYIYLAIISVVFGIAGIYRNNNFFSWGPPITFFHHTITSQGVFYAIHLLILVHQIVNNWVNNVVYPWKINSIQDPKTKKLEYNTFVTLVLLNLFDIYSELDMIFILMGFTSQISFLFTICLANGLTSTIINYRYIKLKSQCNVSNELDSLV